MSLSHPHESLPPLSAASGPYTLPSNGFWHHCNWFVLLILFNITASSQQSITKFQKLHNYLLVSRQLSHLPPEGPHAATLRGHNTHTPRLTCTRQGGSSFHSQTAKHETQQCICLDILIMERKSNLETKSRNNFVKDWSWCWMFQTEAAGLTLQWLSQSLAQLPPMFLE